MNHDNSRLIYREDETPGQPLVSEAQYHEAGPMPARPGDEESIFRHQQFAVHTAIAASIEWVKLIEQNPQAGAAIESAKTWRVRDAETSPRVAGRAGLRCLKRFQSNNQTRQKAGSRFSFVDCGSLGQALRHGRALRAALRMTDCQEV